MRHDPVPVVPAKVRHGTFEDHLGRLESIEQIARRLRKPAPAGFTPFPDVAGEDRDQPRIIEWDFTR